MNFLHECLICLMLPIVGWVGAGNGWKLLSDNAFLVRCLELAMTISCWDDFHIFPRP